MLCRSNAIMRDAKKCNDKKGEMYLLNFQGSFYRKQACYIVSDLVEVNLENIQRTGSF